MPLTIRPIVDRRKMMLSAKNIDININDDACKIINTLYEGLKCNTPDPYIPIVCNYLKMGVDECNKQTCKPQNEACSTDKECCSGVCDFGMCQ